MCKYFRIFFRRPFHWQSTDRSFHSLTDWLCVADCNKVCILSVNAVYGRPLGVCQERSAGLFFRNVLFLPNESVSRASRDKPEGITYPVMFYFTSTHSLSHERQCKDTSKVRYVFLRRWKILQKIIITALKLLHRLSFPKDGAKVLLFFVLPKVQVVTLSMSVQIGV